MLSNGMQALKKNGFYSYLSEDNSFLNLKQSELKAWWMWKYGLKIYQVYKSRLPIAVEVLSKTV